MFTSTYYTHQECSVLAKKKKKEKNLAISQEEANFLSIVCAGVKEILNVIRVCNEGLCVNYSEDTKNSRTFIKKNFERCYLGNFQKITATKEKIFQAMRSDLQSENCID